MVDAGSTDATVQIARTAGATVIERDWTNFLDARRFAVAEVHTPWTFMLDADERIDDRLRHAIIELEPPVEVYGYAVRRVTRFCGVPITALGWNEQLLRMFRTQRGILRAHPVAGGNAALHERWEVNGCVGELSGVLIHESYPDRASYRRKFSRYTTLEAEGVAASPASLVWTAAIALPRFLWLLGPRGGCRAGWRGAYLAFWSAVYPVVVHAKALLRARTRG